MNAEELGYDSLPSTVEGSTIAGAVSHFSHGFAGHHNPCGLDLKSDPDNCGSPAIATLDRPNPPV